VRCRSIRRKRTSSVSPREDCLRLSRFVYSATCSNAGICLKPLIEIEYTLALDEVIFGGHSPVPDKRKPSCIVHDTGDGFIDSRAGKRGGKCLAQHWGEQLDGGRECKREANDFLIQSFAEMFPENGCTKRCRLNPEA
jgi:hypothetical protein